MILTFFQDFFGTFIELLYAPVIYPGMLWILIPVLLAVGLMDLYFSRYPREGVGHHKSLENTIFLIFIAFNLFYNVTINNPSHLKSYITIGFVVAWLMVGLMDFFHKLPTQLILNTSSKLLVAFSAYIAIVLIYTDVVQVSIMRLISIILSVVLLLGILLLIKKILSILEPKSYEEIEHFLQNIEVDMEKVSKETTKIVPEKPKKKKKEPEPKPEPKPQHDQDIEEELKKIEEDIEKVSKDILS